MTKFDPMQSFSKGQILRWCAASAALLALSTTKLQAKPRHLYLTFPAQDATHSLCLNLHLDGIEKVSKAYLTIPELSPKPLVVDAENTQFGKIKISCFRFQLNRLKPGHCYSAKLNVAGQNWSRSLKLRTAPEAGELRFVVAGDSVPGPALRTMLSKASKLDPHFYVYGGDLAYDNGDPDHFQLWEQWMNAVETAADTPSGMVPILAVIGNHEVQGGFLSSRGQLSWEKAHPYDFFFHQSQKAKLDPPNSSYGVRFFGPKLGIWFLDSGHLASPSGLQSDWLSTSLRAHSQLPLKLAVYHVPCYPSVRDPNEAPSRHCRQAWCNIFDSANLTAAFEHHEHSYKRSVPIRNGKATSKGVVYLGDGCLSQTPRDVQRNRWYLHNAIAARHFWFVKIGQSTNAMSATAFGEHHVIDSWTP